MSDDSSIHRFRRQDPLVPREVLNPLHVAVVGVGAVGRNVALQLASLGVRRLTLVDFDVVEETNITTQGYLRSDLGLPKVTALRDACLSIDDRMDIALHPIAWNRRLLEREEVDVVFACPDKIAVREALWRGLGEKTLFWGDARLAGEYIQIYSAFDEESRRLYGATFFPEHEAHQATCTRAGAIYISQIAAGLLVSQFAKWLRGHPLEMAFDVNLPATEISRTCAVNS